MSWWNGISDWWNGEEEAPPPVDNEAQRAQQLAAQWRANVAPTSTAPTQGPATDPLEAALNTWRNSQPAAAPKPMQGPLRPGEQRPMIPQVGPPIAPPSAPADNPWMTAVNAWREGPPSQPEYNPLSSANTGQAARPPSSIDSLLQFNVQPTQVDYALDRPNTGPAGFTGQQQNAPTVSSNVRPNLGPQPYQPEDWLTSKVGDWTRNLGNFGAAADKAITTYAGNVGQYGPVDATLGLLEGTPGYDRFKLTAQEQAAEGSNQGWDKFTDDFWNVASALDVPRKAIETTQIPGTGALLGGDDVSAGQLASATGEMLNKTLNPFNPNQVDESLIDLTRDLLDGGDNTARGIFWDNLRQSQAVRTAFDGLPEELKTQANVAMVNLISGPDRTADTIEAIVSQDDQVAELQAKAQQAQAAGNAQDAAMYGKQANELKNKTKGQIIDEHANAWAEFMGGVFLDPTNFISGPGQETIQAAKSSALMNLSPEQALTALDGVLDKATKAAVGGAVGNWWTAVNPFARTADTNAHMATDTLWRAATNMFADVTSKDQAKAIIDMWTGDPRRLVEGVVLPGSTEIKQWGPGVVANSELIKQYPVLVRARDALLEMGSLAGDPATFSHKEFGAELNDVLYNTARELFGLKSLDGLPAGAANFRTVATATGTTVIEYVDKAGKVLKTSAEMLPYDAQLQAASLKKAITAAGAPGGGGQNALAATWGVQKAILSDMYLGMSPGYWIKNATSAAATLVSDNTMTLLPTKSILNDMMTKFGVAPTTRTADAADSALAGAAREAMGGLHWSERVFGKENPYAKMMNKLYSIPFGATDIAGRVPFGEQNFALRATYVPFKRYLTSQWGDAAKGFEQTLSGIGIDPNLAKTLSATVADIGINGNKSQLAQTMRKLTTGQTIPFSLKELGVPDELVSAESWAKLSGVLSEALPEQLDEAAATVRQIFADEFKQAGELLNSAPPQPNRAVWTEFDSVQDGADVVDSMTDAAKRAGMPGDVAKQEAQALMTTISQAEKGLWDALRGDLAGATDGQSLNVAMDLLAKWYDWRTTARQQVDQLSQMAIKANNSDAWLRKFEGTKQIYGAFPEFFQGAVDTARQNLLKLENKQPIEGGYDWFDVIKRYASYDEAEVRTARTAGMGVGSPQGVGDVFAKAIDANRKYVDKSVVELFSAFRRYPNQNNLDLMADGMRKMEELGAKAASYLATKRAEMLPKGADAYSKLRNQVWAEFFDNAVIHNNVVKRLIVASGVADMAKGALKWTDDFAGGEFQLIGKMQDGFWQARNMATGQLDRFADPVDLAKRRKAGEVIMASMPEVPLKVLQDFYGVIGENTNIVDALIKEIDAPVTEVVQQADELIQPATGVVDEVAPVINPLTRQPVTGTIAPVNASGWNPWGIAESAKQTDLYKLISGINSNVGELLGKKAPEMGEVAQHTIRTLAAAEKQILSRLPELLAGKPNTLTPAQQLRVLDELQKMMPQYDNILAGAVRTGEQMGNYAMLNYNDKRNIDVMLAMIMPYHYFWSRSAKNWLERAVQKPGLVNFWYKSERAIEQENQQSNVPAHLQGTLPNPLGVGPDRIGNPLTFALPFAMYLGSDFVNPDDARSEFERWKMTVQKFAPAMYPAANYAMNYMLDKSTPLAGGKKRTDEFQLGDVLPLYKIAGYGYQAATGDMSWSQGPLGYGDEYDYGRAGKQVALNSLSGDASAQNAMWAPDVGHQLQTGAKPLPEQPAGAAGAWNQGAQEAGWDRFTNRVGAFLTGIPSYTLSPEEKQMREMKETRVGLGYNEVSNPTGSKEAVNAYTNMQPDQFDATFNYSALYPQGNDRKQLRPGERAVQSEYYQQHGVIMNDMTQAVAKYLIENPNASSKDVNDFKAPYWDKVEELKKQYPSLPSSDRKNLNTKYMNPVEHAAGFVQSVLSHKPAGKPVYPGKDATPEDKKQYYLDKAKWDVARLDYYDRQFTQLLNQDDTYPDPWKSAARKMVEDMYSSELLRGYENRYAGDVEKAWSDRQSFVEEVQDAQYKLNDKNVVQRVGQEGAELLSQYYALPKGSEERKAFKQENPQVQAAIMASFQPAEYDAFVKRFGPNAFAMVSGGPQHPGDGASEAQLQQYYDASAAFHDANPQAEAAKLWLNGRRFGAAEGEDSYGAAYDEAVAIFGPNIFEIMNNVPQGKDAFVSWMKNSPQEYMLYTGYKEWKKEYSETDKASYDPNAAAAPGDEAIIPNVGAGTGYEGPRPVGSDRQALGTFDPYAPADEQQPNPWTRYSWDSLLEKPADNPWTQRANELNAGILGGESVPSQMSATPQGRTPTGPQTGPMIPDWGSGAAGSPTGSADLKTARDYASMNEKYVKGEMTRAEWAGRRASVNGYFGAGGAKMFDEYYNLPKGAAREEYIKNNPVMRAINLYAYNKKEVEPALKELGDDALGLWALTPAYADTPEAKAARGAYYDKNPKAFLFHSYLNGRPANYDETKAEGEEFKRNWGADYLQAKEMFGANIWELVSQYKRGWDSTQKRMFYEKNPQYGAWSDWWYGNEKKERSTRTGGGGGGGFGGYARQAAPERKLQVRIQDVYGQGMSAGLGEPPRIAGYQEPSLDTSWMRAGDALRPGPRNKEWSPDWIRGIRKE